MPTSDVEELLAERGLDVSYETVRLWVLKFGPVASAFFDGVRRSEPRALGIDQQTGQHARFSCFSFALMVAGIASELAANSGPDLIRDQRLMLAEVELTLVRNPTGVNRVRTSVNGPCRPAPILV
jgi:hypothetical protein